ncbi:MAG: PilZ domain-containing protein, partial [Planctomycetota bacterium]
ENHCEAAAVNEPVGAQRRAAGRVKVQGVRAGKGVVLDASAGGMRIKGKTPKGCTPGNVLDLEVTGDDESIRVRGEVRWIQRHPFRGATFGIAFVELSNEKRSGLFRIIRRAGAEARCRWMAA